jgi:hypothetical protein
LLYPYDSAESFQFQVWEDPRDRRAALSNAPAPVTRPLAHKSPLKPPPPPAKATKPDPELLRPLRIPQDLRPIEEDDLFLPAMQQRIARIAGIRIFSDYADRSEECLKGESAEAFFRGLDGLPLKVALDKIAAQFDYTWRKSGRWYLFRSRTWKADRQARVAEAKMAEEEEDAPADRFAP